jgi:hypothetical protein
MGALKGVVLMIAVQISAACGGVLVGMVGIGGTLISP